MNVAAAVLSDRTDAPAVAEAGSGRAMSRRQLGEAAGAVQAALADRGVVVGDRVAVFAGNRLELFAAWLGITGHGAVVTTVNLLLGPAETTSIIDNLDPAVILADTEWLDRATAASGGRPVVDLGRIDPRGHQLEPVDRDDGDLACIAYTSGTTGRLPKGAMHSHGVLRAMLSSTVEALGLEPGDEILAFLPQFQLPAVACSGLTLLSIGGSCTLFDRLDVPGIATLLASRPIRYFSSVPTALYDLATYAEQQGMSFDSLRIVTVGGAPAAPALRARARAVGIPVGTVYGSTESAGGASVERPDDEVRPGSCGRPVPGFTISVRDDEGNECPPGAEGEVCFDAARACIGYWRNPEATAASIRDGWFRTGDVGRFDEDGRLYVVDRLKDLIIRGGFNIAPSEVERALVTNPDVAEAAVLGRPDERLGETPVAFVVAAEGKTVDPDALRAYAREQLGPVKTPVQIDVVDREWFPRSALGKIQKALLAERLGWK
jgi:acyl-CoA synthetase (AMP-forming)/AMP-acid ligase II